MKKNNSVRWLILFALLLPLQGLIAQQVVYSAPEKFDYRSGEYAVVGMVGGQLFNYRNGSDGAILEAFNDSMRKTATVLLDFFPVKIYDSKFIAYPNKINTLYQALEGNKVVQYAAQLDERGILVGKPLQLGSVKTGIFGAMKTYFYNVVSDNKQQIVIYSVKQWAKEMEIDFRWLNDSMQLVKKSKATFKTQENLEYGYINVANDGTIYISAYTPTGTHGYADQMWLLSLAPGETRFVEHPLPLNDKYISNGYTRIDNINNKVYFGGYYSNSRNGNSDGIIYASYNISSGQYETVNFLPIDDTLLNALDAAKGSRTFENYDVRQIIPKNDGGFVLISESYYMTNRSSYMPGLGYYSTFYSPYNTTMVKEYHYEDILAISCNASGHREWCSLIPKEQYSQDDGGVFASYLLLNSGGSLSFLFNDFNSLRSRIQLATIDNNGTVTHGGFNLAKNDESDWLPKAGKQVAARVLIVPCLRKKQICFAKVVF